MNRTMTHEDRVLIPMSRANEFLTCGWTLYYYAPEGAYLFPPAPAPEPAPQPDPAPALQWGDLVRAADGHGAVGRVIALTPGFVQVLQRDPAVRLSHWSPDAQWVRVSTGGVFEVIRAAVMRAAYGIMWHPALVQVHPTDDPAVYELQFDNPFTDESLVVFAQRAPMLLVERVAVTDAGFGMRVRIPQLWAGMATLLTLPDFPRLPSADADARRIAYLEAQNARLNGKARHWQKQAEAQDTVHARALRDRDMEIDALKAALDRAHAEIVALREALDCVRAYAEEA